MEHQPEAEPTFIDGEQVTQLINSLECLNKLLTKTLTNTQLPVNELPTNNKELTIQAEAGSTDTKFPSEYASNDFKHIKDTDFYRNIELLTDWARITNIERLILDGTITTDPNGTKSGRLTLTLYPTETQLSAYYLRIKFTDDGDPIITLFAQPTYYGEPDSGEIHWRCSDFDVDEAIEFLEEKRPYCGSRVSELIEDLGCNESHAKAQALRETGLSHEEIADRLNITTNASTSYTSKLSANTETGLKQSFALGEDKKRFITSQEFPTQACGHTKTRYILKSIEDNTAYLITRDEYSSAHPDNSVNGIVKTYTHRYDSLTALFNDNKVVDHQEELNAWTTVIRGIGQEWLPRSKQELVEELTM